MVKEKQKTIKFKRHRTMKSYNLGVKKGKVKIKISGKINEHIKISGLPSNLPSKKHKYTDKVIDVYDI